MRVTRHVRLKSGRRVGVTFLSPPCGESCVPTELELQVAADMGSLTSELIANMTRLKLAKAGEDPDSVRVESVDGEVTTDPEALAVAVRDLLELPASSPDKAVIEAIQALRKERA